MSHILIITGIPDSVSSVQLKVLLKEVCHINVKAKNIVETQSNGKKVVILDTIENVIPKIAKHRIQQLGLQVMPGLEVYHPFTAKKDLKMGLPNNILTKLEIPPFDTEPLQVAIAVVEWLHYELHLKYPQLKAIDDKYNGQVYKALGLTITERVIKMLNAQKINRNTRATITLYRSWHPFVTDFRLVLSHIHTVEKQNNSPPSELSEANLLVPTSPPPFEARIEESWNNDKQVLEKKVQEYIASLDTVVKPDDSEEMVARKKVRQALKEFSCQVPQILRYTPTKDYADTTEWICLFVLGETGLPRPMVVKTFLSQQGIVCYDVTLVYGRNSLSSAYLVYIARSDYDKIMKLDGCQTDFKQSNLPPDQVATAKLYIRHLNSDYRKDKILPALIDKLKLWHANRPKEAPLIKRPAAMAPRPTAAPFRSTWRYTPPKAKKFKPNPFGPRFSK